MCLIESHTDGGALVSEILDSANGARFLVKRGFHGMKVTKR
jgi:hypothetical protein